MKDFLKESSWNVEVVHFLLFSPVLLVSTLRFMTAYVTLGLLTQVLFVVPLLSIVILPVGVLRVLTFQALFLFSSDSVENACKMASGVSLPFPPLFF